MSLIFIFILIILELQNFKVWMPFQNNQIFQISWISITRILDSLKWKRGIMKGKHTFLSVEIWKFSSIRNLMKTYYLFQVKFLWALSSKQTKYERNGHNFLPLFIYLTKLVCSEEAEKLSCEMTSMRILSLWE